MSAIVLEHNPDRSDDQQGTLMPKHLFRSVELGLALDQHYSPASSSSQGTLPRPAAAVPVFGRRGKSFESDGDSAAGHTVGDAAPFAIMKADAKEENRLNGSTPRQGGVLSPPPPPRLPQLGPKIPFPPVLPFSNEDSEEDSPVPAPSATVTDGAIGRANLWRQMLNMDAGSVEEDDPRLASIVKENAHVLEQGVVLPCAPSEEEKVLPLTGEFETSISGIAVNFHLHAGQNLSVFLMGPACLSSDTITIFVGVEKVPSFDLHGLLISPSSTDMADFSGFFDLDFDTLS